MQEVLEEKERSFDLKKTELEKKVDGYDGRLREVETEKNVLENKCQMLKKEIAQMHSQTKQVLKLARKDNGETMYEDGFDTQREKDLFLELEATKISLSETTRKVKMYSEEKLRFIDTISQMVSYCLRS